MKKISDSIVLNPKNAIRIFNSGVSCLIQGQKSGLPLRLQVELSGKCNLACEMCPHSYLDKKNKTSGFISFETYKKLFEQINPLLVDFTGQGEAMLNPEIYKIADYTNKKGVRFGFNSNFTLLGKENFYRLYKTGICYLGLSLDSINKKTYEKIRIGASFDKVISNFKAALKIDVRKILTIGTVITDLNIDELEDIILYCRKNFPGVPFVFSPPLSYGLEVMESYFKEKEIFTAKKRYFISKISKVKQLASKLNLKDTAVSLADSRDYFSSDRTLNTDKACYMPYLNLMAFSNGNVYPCCYMPFNKNPFGNVFYENFSDIWNNKKFFAFRKALKANRKSIRECSLCRFTSSQAKYLLPVRRMLFLK
ncbi:MAG: radical SAM protein [archaeon]